MTMNPYSVDPLKKAKYYIGDFVLIRKYDCYLVGQIKNILSSYDSLLYEVDIPIITEISSNYTIKTVSLVIDETIIIKTITVDCLRDADIYPKYLFNQDIDCMIVNTYNENLDKLQWCPLLYEEILHEPEKNIDTKFKKNEIVYEKETYHTCIILDISFASINKNSFGTRIYLIKNKDTDSIYFIYEDDLLKMTTDIKKEYNKLVDQLKENKNKIDRSPVDVIIGNDNTKDVSFKFNIGDTVKFKQYEMIDGYILDTIYLKIEDRFTIKEKKYYALSIIDYMYTNECGIIIRAEDQLELIIDKLDDYSVHGYDTRRILWRIKKFKE